jgi:hypothetical protein
MILHWLKLRPSHNITLRVRTCINRSTDWKNVRIRRCGGLWWQNVRTKLRVNWPAVQKLKGRRYIHKYKARLIQTSEDTDQHRHAHTGKELRNSLQYEFSNITHETNGKRINCTKERTDDVISGKGIIQSLTTYAFGTLSTPYILPTGGADLRSILNAVTQRNCTFRMPTRCQILTARNEMVLRAHVLKVSVTIPPKSCKAFLDHLSECYFSRRAVLRGVHRRSFMAHARTHAHTIRLKL